MAQYVVLGIPTALGALTGEYLPHTDPADSVRAMQALKTLLCTTSSDLGVIHIDIHLTGIVAQRRLMALAQEGDTVLQLLHLDPNDPNPLVLEEVTLGYATDNPLRGAELSRTEFWQMPSESGLDLVTLRFAQTPSVGLPALQGGPAVLGPLVCPWSPHG